MSILYFLEGLRTGILDSIMLAVTRMGEETLFIIIGLLFFWCVDKYEGYFILSVGLLGTVINQFLKISFRIERPWVADPEFTIVERARAAAGGYSFPSGHTQSAVGVYGGIARYSKRRWVRITATIICLLVPFSRMYLGVHTPADVGVAFLIAAALVFALYPIVANSKQNHMGMWLLLAVVVAACTAFLLYVELYRFPADLDMANYHSAQKNAYTLAGCILGFLFTYYIDTEYTRFETKAVLWVQFVKAAAGIALVLGIKSVLKAPLVTLFGGHPAASTLRYFIVVAVAGGLWPATFGWFSRLGRQNAVK